MLDSLFRGSDEPTAYEPAIPTIVTNFGAAWWKFQADDARARVFAPRWPPHWALGVAALITCIALTPVVLGYMYPSALNGNAKTLSWAAVAPVTLGLTGIWAVMLGGNRPEHSRGDLLRCDLAAKTLELPRRQLELPLAEVSRIELVWFALGGGARTVWCRDLVLARRVGDSGETFEFLVRNAGSMARVGQDLAACLGVPFERRNAGVYDWTTKRRIRW